MKRSNAASLKPTDLARQRARIRDLIERNIWAGTIPSISQQPPVLRSTLSSNIIPFPTLRK
jgi:hypothetical protein